MENQSSYHQYYQMQMMPQNTYAVQPYPPTQNSGEFHQCEWQENGPCGQIFPALDQLVYHINLHHLNSANNVEHACFWSNCSRGAAKPFKAKYKLLNHVRIHTGEKPFACTFMDTSGAACGKKFARSENLKIHLRSHTGEKPFKCFQPDCEKTFSNSSDRKKHMNVHKKGVLECPVPDCGRIYHHPSSMRKHFRSHQDWKNYSMPETRIRTQKRKAEEIQFEPDFPESKTSKKSKLDDSITELSSCSSDRQSVSPISVETRITDFQAPETFFQPGTVEMPFPFIPWIQQFYPAQETIENNAAYFPM